MKSTQIKRRDFLKAGALGVAATQLPFTAASYANVVGANEQLNVAVIGVNGRGKSHLDGFSSSKDTRIAALCDVDSAILVERNAEWSKKLGHSLKNFSDYKEVLADSDIDIVSIATPNHWHSLMTVDSVKAGKSVYTEKPVCHNLVEGRKMIDAIKESGQVVGAGFQNRSDIGIREAFGDIQSGKFGKIVSVRGCCYRERRGIGKSETPVAPPETLDYDRWLGPAKDETIYRPSYHYDWHWDYNTGNGDMGNQGPHEIDMMRWVLGDPKHMKSVQSSGGRFVWNDAGNSFNMQFASFDFGDGVDAIFEVRNMVKGKTYSVGGFKGGPGVGVTITCEKGIVHAGRGHCHYLDLDGKVIRDIKGDSGATHFQNFADAVRANDISLIRSEMESAYYSSCVAHLANANVRAGRPANGEEVAASVAGTALLPEVAERFNKQLVASGVDFAETPWLLGEKLGFDAEAERFTTGKTAEAANVFLGREDRKPYVIS